MNTYNDSFVNATNLNPEFAYSKLCGLIDTQDIYLKKLFKEFDNLKNNLNNEISELKKEIKFYEWYNNISFFKRLYWKLKNYNINTIKLKYYE